MEFKIGFAGTDGRTLLGALTVSSAMSEYYENDYQGLVVRGTPAMPEFVKKMKWPVKFIPTESNHVDEYFSALVTAIRNRELDYVVPMPEGLLFNGLVDRLIDAGLGGYVIGLTQAGSFMMEGDKIQCRELCEDFSLPIPEWRIVDASSYSEFRDSCLFFLHEYNGVVAKFPFSAGGKGARIIKDIWDIRQVYEWLMDDYSGEYKKSYGGSLWPMLIEEKMAGVEISFTILVDASGDYQILPTAMDYPERFPGPASILNPITGGMGAISPHPMETPELLEMAAKQIAEPLIKILYSKGQLRPCVLYPGCIVSLENDGTPRKIRICEVNVRPGEPEVQPVFRRLRNLGPMIQAMKFGRLDNVEPEVREDQISMCLALVTGPGGPDGQKGYPWGVTKGEVVDIDYKYLKKKSLQLIPSAMKICDKTGQFLSDGTRVAFLNGNASKIGSFKYEASEKLRLKLLRAYWQNRVRVCPREAAKEKDKEARDEMNRLAIREDIGEHYQRAGKIFV